MTVEFFLLLLFIGFLAGFINIVAAGGSLLTLPILIFMGLPSAIANGTNRMAILAQNIVAITSFKKNGYFDWKFSLLLAIPAVIGSIVGSAFAINLPDDIFNKVLSIVMIVVLILMVRPSKANHERNELALTQQRKIITVITFFSIGFYGGFIQAGVGFFIMTALVTITNMTLVRINSIKVFIIAVFLLSSLIVFIINGQINWIYGWSLAIGTGFGGYVGAKFALKKGEKWIRNIVLVTVSIMAIKLWFI